MVDVVFLFLPNKECEKVLAKEALEDVITAWVEADGETNVT